MAIGDLDIMGLLGVKRGFRFTSHWWQAEAADVTDAARVLQERRLENFFGDAWFICLFYPAEWRSG